MGRTLPDLRGGLRRAILHVRPEAASAAGIAPVRRAIDECLQSSSSTADVVDNVYLALAKLCAGDSNHAQPRSAARLVVVCVDELGPAELEFFDILGRVRQELPVLVYGGERSDAKIAAAIARGARGRATAETILAAVEAPDEGRCASSELREAPGRSAQLDVEPPASIPEDDAECADIGPDGQEIYDEDGDSDSPARVPWLRYEGKPRRAAPMHTAPSSRRAPPADRAPHDAHPEVEDREHHEPDAPLLTLAELEALVGDDISAFTNDEPDDSAPDDDSHREKQQ